MGDKSKHPTIGKLARQIRGAFGPRVPKSSKEEQEFGKGKIDLVMCPECDSVYYEKSWHHRLEDYKQLSEDKRIKFLLCPACQMIKNKTYEGKVSIASPAQENIEKELLNLIKNVGQRAFKRDPLDRIIKIKKTKGKIEVLTTENQLAVSIAKQIKRAFKGKLDIKWSHQEDVVRIDWER